MDELTLAGPLGLGEDAVPALFFFFWEKGENNFTRPICVFMKYEEEDELWPSIIRCKEE